MPSVRFVNGAWFAYLDDRVLGPFKSEKAAWRAIREEVHDA